MKKITLGLMLLGTLSASVSSCKNSVECCDNNSSYYYTISRASYPVPGTFKLAIDEAEADGYSCE